MTTLSISSPKAQGFYSQGLQDKLYPFMENGRSLTLDDAIRLIHLASDGSWWAMQTGQDQAIGSILADIESASMDTTPFDGFDSDADEFRAIKLELAEWLALARWASELAELRLHDYSRSPKITAVPPTDWEVKNA